MATPTADLPDEPITQEQFFRWVSERPGDDTNHYELLAGRVVVSPPAGFPHGRIEARLVTALSSHVAAHRLGHVFGSSQGYDLPSGDTLEPDASFISSARWTAGPAPVAGRFLRIVPDLAIEILSPSTESRDRSEKLESYRANGVAEYWLVDPPTRSVAVIDLSQRGRSAATTFAQGSAESSLLPGLAVDVEALFSD